MGKKKKNQDALLYFISTCHFVISMLLILFDFFFLKHANINDIKVLYHFFLHTNLKSVFFLVT